MRLPQRGLAINQGRAIQQIRSAIDHRVNYLDTAPDAGESEALLGKALADGYRDKVKVVAERRIQLVLDKKSSRTQNATPT